MKATNLTGRQAVSGLILLGTCLWSPSAHAYDRYSQNGDATNCRACHGEFRSANYISPTDGMDWGNLHNLHRFDMVAGDCAVCHMSADDFPVFIADADGGDGMESISCVGCHGRAEDNVPGNPDFNHGYGAGLRQHHTSNGVAVCAQCHADATPANYTPVGEDVLPPYYANPGIGHPSIPTDPCNADGSENFAGLPQGLDNDGDDLFDLADADCGAVQGCRLNCPEGDGGLVNLTGDGDKSPDMNGSGAVDVVDFGMFGSAFNGAEHCADFDCSGTVNLVDFALFATHYNHGPGTAGVCQ